METELTEQAGDSPISPKRLIGRFVRWLSDFRDGLHELRAERAAAETGGPSGRPVRPAAAAPIEVSPGTICVQPPCRVCLGEGGEWWPIDEDDPDSDEEWEPCSPCFATGLEQFTGWPPPLAWCHDV